MAKNIEDLDLNKYISLFMNATGDEADITRLRTFLHQSITERLVSKECEDKDALFTKLISHICYDDMAKLRALFDHGASLTEQTLKTAFSQVKNVNTD